MTPLYLILTLCHAGQPDQVVSVRVRLTPVECSTMAPLYAQEWLADQPGYAGWRVKGAVCGGKAEGSA